MIDVLALGGYCTAIAAIVAIIKWVVKPIYGINEKVHNHEKQLEKLCESLRKQDSVNKLNMETQYVIVEHLRTNNCTGKMEECSKKLQNFLIEEGGSLH